MGQPNIRQIEAFRSLMVTGSVTVSARMMGITQPAVFRHFANRDVLWVEVAKVVAIFLEIPNAILGEAFLSFLGLGVKPPNTSWGVLADEGYRAVEVQPYLLWVPAVLIASTVLAAVAVADGVRDALDPRGQIH